MSFKSRLLIYVTSQCTKSMDSDPSSQSSDTSLSDLLNTSSNLFFTFQSTGKKKNNIWSDLFSVFSCAKCIKVFLDAAVLFGPTFIRDFSDTR